MSEPVVRTEHLSKRFGPVTALDDLDLEEAAGEVFGFLGPNGAGKSTTIRLLLALIRPTAGRAWIFGTDAADVAHAHRLLAYVPADVALWPQLTGAEILELLARTGPGVDAGYQAELIERFASIDGARVPPGGPRGTPTWTDGVSQLASAPRGGSGLRPGGDPARRPAGRRRHRRGAPATAPNGGGGQVHHGRTGPERGAGYRSRGRGRR
jgi:energy-coupling factor transporter ATP-binding protein EcfA2